MTAQRDDVSKPAWFRDRLDFPYPSEIEPAYFDSNLQAWVLSRHADLLAAFHARSLVPGRRDLASACLESDRVLA